MIDLPPCPFAVPADDDLTGVLTRLGHIRSRGGSTPRDPNESETRWLLEAGIRALADGVIDRGAHPSGPVAYAHANGLFDALPLETVMTAFRAMCLEVGHDPGSANKARIIRRWGFAANYQLDLVAYLFRPSVHAARMIHAEELLRDIVPVATFGELVDGIVAAELTLEPIATVHRLQGVARMMFPTDEAVRGFAARNYGIQIEGWGRLFAALAAAYELPLGREPHVFTDLSTMLGLVLEGGYVRSTGTADHAACADGTPVTHAVVHRLLSAVTGRPWPTLAPLRATTWPDAGASPEHDRGRHPHGTG